MIFPSIFLPVMDCVVVFFNLMAIAHGYTFKLNVLNGIGKYLDGHIQTFFRHCSAVKFVEILITFQIMVS